MKGHNEVCLRASPFWNIAPKIQFGMSKLFDFKGSLFADMTFEHSAFNHLPNPDLKHVQKLAKPNFEAVARLNV